jgi:hypothetical protein
MDLNSYIVVSVMTGCFCVGLIIKNLVPNKKINRYIPLIMGALGVLLNAWLNVWVLSVDVLIEGLVSGLASTGMFELGKNLIKIKEDK